MSRFTSRQELLDDADQARARLERLLASIPDEAKLVEVTDGMSVKDFLTHRTEWGRMAMAWYTKARSGGIPAVPSETYGWGRLKELNAEIHARFADTPLDEAESQFRLVHDQLRDMIAGCTEDELFTKRYYPFTGSSDLATYFTSATGGHDRSAYTHINRWWRTAKQAYARD